jgi:hypothetical protein
MMDSSQEAHFSFPAYKKEIFSVAVYKSDVSPYIETMHTFFIALLNLWIKSLCNTVRRPSMLIPMNYSMLFLHGFFRKSFGVFYLKFGGFKGFI